MSVAEKKSRRTLTISNEPSSSSSHDTTTKKHNEDKTPTQQRLVYVSANPVLEAYDINRQELGKYFTRLVKGYIYGKQTEEKDGKKHRLWEEVTPWPIEFVPLGHPDVMNLDIASLHGSSSVEQFVSAFKSSSLRRQLARKSGPGLVHGWIFNFDGYIEHKGQDLNGCLDLLHAIVRGDEATWAFMHTMYYRDFNGIGRLIGACASGFTAGVAGQLQFVPHAMSSEIHRLAKDKPDTTDWKEMSNRWRDDVLEPLSMVTSPPNTDTQKRMLDTLDLVLGKNDGSLVASDMKRCLLPPGRRKPLQPNDARYAISPYPRHLLIFGLLWKMVEAATPAWNERYWPVARWPIDFKERWSLINKTRIFDIDFTDKEEKMADQSDVAVYDLSMYSAQELASKIAEVSPQMRKDRLLGGNLLTYTSIKGGGRSISVHPASKLTGRGRYWPDSKSGGNKTPGTMQIVTSFLGKASDQALRDTVSRFEDDDEQQQQEATAKRQRDYNTDTVGSYRPFLSTSTAAASTYSTSTGISMSAGARLQTSRKKLLLSSSRG
jgi:hypothetical protein